MKKIIILIASLFMAYVAFSQNNFYAKTIFWNDAKHRDSLFIQGPAGAVAGYYLKCVNDSGLVEWAPVTADTSVCSDTLFTGKYLPDTSDAVNVLAITVDTAIYSVAGNIVTVSGLISRIATDGPTQSVTLSLPIVGEFEHDYDLTGVVSSSVDGNGWFIKADTVNEAAILYLGNDTIPGGFFTYTFSYWIPDNITQCVPCNISGGGGGVNLGTPTEVAFYGDDSILTSNRKITIDFTGGGSQLPRLSVADSIGRGTVRSGGFYVIGQGGDNAETRIRQQTRPSGDAATLFWNLPNYSPSVPSFLRSNNGDMDWIGEDSVGTGGGYSDSTNCLVMNGASGNIYAPCVSSGAALRNDVILDNIAIGRATMVANDSCGFNTAVGSGALENLRGDFNGFNVAIGNGAARNLTPLDDGFSITNPMGNVAVGYQAMYNTLNSTGNVAIGNGALIGNLIFSGGGLPYTGSLNIGIGQYAGIQLSNGERNILIGAYTCNYDNPDSGLVGSRNVVIGTNAKVLYTEINNSIVLGDSATADNNNQFTLSDSITHLKMNGLGGTTGQVLGVDSNGYWRAINIPVANSSFSTESYGTTITQDTTISLYVYTDSSGVAAILNLDPNAPIGTTVTVKDGNGSATVGEPIWIDSQTGNTIDAAQVYEINTAWGAVTIKKISATLWVVLSKG